MVYFVWETNYQKCDFMRYLGGKMIYIYGKINIWNCWWKIYIHMWTDYGNIYGYGYEYTGFENVEILLNELAM